MSNPDFQDVKVCICGDVMDEDQEFCSSACEQDFYEVAYLMHLETQQYYTTAEVLS